MSLTWPITTLSKSFRLLWKQEQQLTSQGNSSASLHRPSSPTIQTAVQATCQTNFLNKAYESSPESQCNAHLQAIRRRLRIATSVASASDCQSPHSIKVLKHTHAASAASEDEDNQSTASLTRIYLSIRQKCVPKTRPHCRNKRGTSHVFHKL